VSGDVSKIAEASNESQQTEIANERLSQSQTIVGTAASSDRQDRSPLHYHLLWDRKTEGGFPDVKELKRRVRDLAEPGRDLGHVDRAKAAQAPKEEE
jgi:predicted Rdx family selenoprotein